VQNIYVLSHKSLVSSIGWWLGVASSVVLDYVEEEADDEENVAIFGSSFPHSGQLPRPRRPT
jgi:hypothetical protein